MKKFLLCLFVSIFMFNVVATENPEDGENLINPFYVIEENPKPEED